LEIRREETAGELADRLSELAAIVTREEVPKVVLGERSAVPQEHALATHAPPLTRADGALDFSRTAEALVNQICGLSPRPGAHARVVRGDSAPRGLKVLRARTAPQIQTGAPGTVIIDGTRLLVATGQGLLEIVEAQVEGKRALPARDLVNGRALQEGDRLVTDGVEHSP
jgi:methionyl-tRNA formyltransferase